MPLENLVDKARRERFPADSSGSILDTLSRLQQSQAQGPEQFAEHASRTSWSDALKAAFLSSAVTTISQSQGGLPNLVEEARQKNFPKNLSNPSSDPSDADEPNLLTGLLNLAIVKAVERLPQLPLLNRLKSNPGEEQLAQAADHIKQLSGVSSGRIYDQKLLEYANQATENKEAGDLPEPGQILEASEEEKRLARSVADLPEKARGAIIAQMFKEREEKIALQRAAIVAAGSTEYSNEKINTDQTTVQGRTDLVTSLLTRSPWLIGGTRWMLSLPGKHLLVQSAVLGGGVLNEQKIPLKSLSGDSPQMTTIINRPPWADLLERYFGYLPPKLFHGIREVPSQVLFVPTEQLSDIETTRQGAILPQTAVYVRHPLDFVRNLVAIANAAFPPEERPWENAPEQPILDHIRPSAVYGEINRYQRVFDTRQAERQTYNDRRTKSSLARRHAALQQTLVKGGISEEKKAKINEELRDVTVSLKIVIDRLDKRNQGDKKLPGASEDTTSQ